MENQPGGWFSPLLPFVQCLRFSCRTLGDAHGIRSRGTDSPIPVLTAHQSPVPPAGELKVSPAFSKACGFSGQRPESRSAERETPLLIPALPESTKLSLKARPQTRNSPARQARSWNPFPWNGFPYPRPYCAPSPCQTAVSATLMESVPVERIPLSPSLLRTLSLSDRSFGDAHGIRSRGTNSPIPVLTAHPQSIRPHFGRRSWNPFPWNGFPYPHPYCAPSPCQTTVWARCKGKDRPEGRSFHERTLCAEYCATCGSRFHFYFG
ncbi:hypothetical protein HMPREF1526_02761 [Butyricicoccus pullicaecorum 1.2]|uniref:Uncharacterized protein n=1 Tax=Butyricicoccus pullicaecorum 1.2 TaxID=1203606 RepID=R8VT53_9FIRM|nr:hypothetical protein HMPREF1526_02761 [Butyricicoccus pullicaecorum 1.2]